MGWAGDEVPDYSAAYTVSILILILMLILMILMMVFVSLLSLFPSSRPGSTYCCATLTLRPSTFLVSGLALFPTRPLTR